jgi:anthranilate phosphoribosyltransferase
MDELSLTGPSMVHAVTDGLIDERTVDPAEFGLATCVIEDLRGGDCRHNAVILTAIVDGTERGPKRDIVLFNAAAGFVITGLAADLGAGLGLAREQIDSGRALEKLRALQSFSR